MGKFSVSSVVKGIGRYCLAPLTVWPVWAAMAALAAPAFYVKYDQLNDDTHLKALHSRAERSSTSDGRYVVREEFFGERRDLVVKDTTSGLERILALPASDETFPLFKDGALRFMSDKDALFPGKGVAYDLYTLDPGTMVVDRVTYSNSVWRSAGRFAASWLPLALGITAGVLGAGLAYSAAQDRKRLRAGKRPLNLHTMLIASHYTYFGTDEGKAYGRDLMRKECCPSMDMLFPELDALASDTVDARRRALDALHYMGTEHEFLFLPVITRYLLARNRRGHLARIDKQPAGMARDMSRAVTHAIHEEYCAALSSIDTLLRDNPADGFCNLWAAEFYTHVLRRANEPDHSRYSDIRTVDARRCSAAQSEQLRKGMALRCKENPALQHISGSKNKVFFFEDQYLGDIIVLKTGGEYLRKEYDKLQFLHGIQPFGMVPFPIAFMNSNELHLPNVDATEHLLVCRRLPGKSLAEYPEYSAEIGHALAAFQSRGTVALPRAKGLVQPYSYNDLLSRKIEPRIQEHLGISLDGDVRSVIDERQWGPTGLVHGDMTGFNGMYIEHPSMGRNVSFLDVEALRLAPFAADVGSFLAHFSCKVTDAAVLIDAFREAHDTRMSRDRFYDAAWRSCAFHWVYQVSIMLEWGARGKLSSEQKKGRAKGYVERLDTLLHKEPFASTASTYAGSLRSLHAVEERLSRV